jgi:hypothetical protein
MVCAVIVAFAEAAHQPLVLFVIVLFVIVLFVIEWRTAILPAMPFLRFYRISLAAGFQTNCVESSGQSRWFELWIADAGRLEYR